MSLNEKRFSLYSPDRAKYGPEAPVWTDSIEFYNPYARPEDLSAPVAAHITTGVAQYSICELDYFAQPGSFGAGFRELKRIETSPKPNAKAEIHFIDENYLMLKLSRDLVWSQDLDPAPYLRSEEEMPEDAPQIYTYYGVRLGYIAKGPPDDEEMNKEIEKMGLLELFEWHIR